jgi:hypothetical protein
MERSLPIEGMSSFAEFKQIAWKLGGVDSGAAAAQTTESWHEAHHRSRPMPDAVAARIPRRLRRVENTVWFIEAFVDGLDLVAAGCEN